MVPVKQAAAEFLAKKRIAVTGASRAPKDHGSNVVYKRLRDRGYQVFAVNPNDQVEGDRCYHDLASGPGGIEAVVIGTKPETAEAHHVRMRRPGHQARVDAPRGAARAACRPRPPATAGGAGSP
jgi:predicted CoA-binding protein